MVEDDSDETPSAGGETFERARRGRAYPADGITVYFNARLCQHGGACVRGLPEVFDVTRRPWIRSDLDTPENVAAQVDKCPTGALSYELGKADGSSP